MAYWTPAALAPVQYREVWVQSFNTPWSTFSAGTKEPQQGRDANTISHRRTWSCRFVYTVFVPIATHYLQVRVALQI